ncbi:secretin N-terminal domain-containing protein [Desulfatitalea alkaliphila]|uniref:General secretion pathway protein D n=1 Tax=Desulfatitalea alkaliphila TaxID=2929485 RepID=A0AA41UHU2_9BACT|nr:secretin N-terminal domain-containing protein [Desulfatitalea alkaliphila]MCJ8499379.1 hypothetical protein [Desulfatitalea alkaliphila]
MTIPKPMPKHRPVLVLIALLACLTIIGACAHRPPAESKAANPPAPALEAEAPEARAVSTPITTEVPRQNDADPLPDKVQPFENPSDRLSVAGRAPRKALQTAPQRPGAILNANGSDPEPNPEASSKQGGITLNFDDADIYEVIRTMTSLLGINYIVDPGVRGRVTIQTAGAIRPDELFGVFYQILEANGLTAIEEGPVYRITTLKDAARLPLKTHHGTDHTPLPPGRRIVMQIIPLNNILAAEMTKLLTPFVSADGTIIADADTNTLLLVDRDSNIEKALQLVETFDIDLYEGVRYHFFRIDHVYVNDIVPVIESAMAAFPAGFRSEVKLIPIERINTLLVMARQQRQFDRVKDLLFKLDTPSEGTQSQIFIYSVQNGEADDLAGLLDRTFSKTAVQGQGEKPKEETVRRTDPNPFLRAEERPAEANQETVPVLESGALPGTLRGDIRIVPDTARNLLIIEALPTDWPMIQAVLARLDILARQVLIEAMIAEIRLDDRTELGLEFQYVEGPGWMSTTLLGAATGVGGLQYMIGQTNRWNATLSALAKKEKINVLSSPTLLASNGKEARIEIADEVPVASAQFRYGGGTEPPVTQTSIDYRTTGIILNVTPHINENGMVTMDIRQEVSQQAGNVTVGDQSYPSFFKRSVNTNLTVGHNQTIVLGGLIREDEERTRTGVPFLSRIPLLGFLFGKDVRSGVKTELIILITPRVIVHLGDVDAITDDFSQKVKRIRYPADS